MRAPTRTWLALAALLAFAGAASAGSLRVGPTLVVLDPAHPVAVVRVTNNNAATTSIDVRAVDWRQADNQDVYTETQQLIVTPPVFDLAPGETQTVRVGLNPLAGATAAAQVERSFRVYVSELPDQRPNAARTQMLMRVGVPVFIPTTDARADLTWKLTRTNGAWKLEATNNGAAHARVTRMELNIGEAAVANEITGAYILPGTTRSWTVPAAGLAYLAEADLHVEHYDGPDQSIRLLPVMAGGVSLAQADRKR